MDFLIRQRLIMFSRYLTAAMLLGAGIAHAQTDAPARPLDMETMTPAQKASLPPRRETEQVVAAPLPTVTNGYRPTLTPPTLPGVPNATGTLPVQPAPAGADVRQNAPLPVPVSNCTTAGCTGADGTRYNTGAAGVTVDAAGRTCRKIGNTMQCN